MGVNHHVLSDFRAGNGVLFDELLSNMIASLVKTGEVEGATIIQDGTRVRGGWHL